MIECERVDSRGLGEVSVWSKFEGNEWIDSETHWENGGRHSIEEKRWDVAIVNGNGLNILMEREGVGVEWMR